jgi:hypothetical protein
MSSAVLTFRLFTENVGAGQGLDLEAARRGAAGVGYDHDVRDSALFRKIRKLRDTDSLIRVVKSPREQPIFSRSDKRSMSRKINDQLLERSQAYELVDFIKNVLRFDRRLVVYDKLDTDPL